jgi:hypothetical protein
MLLKYKRDPDRCQSGVNVPIWLLNSLSNPNQVRVMSWLLYWFDSPDSSASFRPPNKKPVSLMQMTMDEAEKTDKQNAAESKENLAILFRPFDTDAYRRLPAALQHDFIQNQAKMEKVNALRSYRGRTMKADKGTLCRSRHFDGDGLRCWAGSYSLAAEQLNMDRKTVRRILHELHEKKWVFLFGEQPLKITLDGRRLGIAFYRMWENPETALELKEEIGPLSKEGKLPIVARNRKTGKKLLAGWFESATRKMAMNRRKRNIDFYGTLPAQPFIWVDDDTFIACKKKMGPAILLAQVRHVMKRQDVKVIARSIYRWSRQTCIKTQYLSKWFRWLDKAGLLKIVARKDRLKWTVAIPE